MRKHLVVFFCLVVLIVTHHAIYSRERLLTDGRVVLLRLVPVDPRSLMQGDYMRLRFEAEEALTTSIGAGRLTNDQGSAIFVLDMNDVASFRHVDDGRELSDTEIRMRYRIRNGRLHFASNAFFFEEGAGDEYSDAEFGEFRVDPRGVSVLTHLRDGGLQRLGRSAVGQ